MDVWQEGVVEGEPEPDEGPDEHDERCGEGQFGRGEERPDVRQIDLLELALQHRGCVGGLLTLLVEHLQIGEGEVAALPVPPRDFMHDPHRVCVFSSSHQELGRLEQGEEEEAAEEHDHRHPAHGDHEVPPPEVLGLGARLRLLLTGMVAQQRPGDERGDELRKRPEDGEDGEEVLVRAGEEFEEDGAVDGQVAAYSDGPEGGEAADRCEVGGAGCDEAEDGGDADGEVEGPAPAEYVACNFALISYPRGIILGGAVRSLTSKTPEYGAHQQPDILRQRQ